MEQRLNNVLDYLIFHRQVKNDSDFARKVGVSRGTVSDIKKGTRNITEKIAEKIERAFPIFDKVWLYTGQGEMFKSSLEGENSNATSLNRSAVRTMKVPVVPVRAHAGRLCGYGDPEYFDSLETMDVLVDKDYMGIYRIFIVSGDSLDDRSCEALLDGDRVLCRSVPFDEWRPKLHTNRWTYWVFVTRTEGIVIKKIKSQNTETGEIVLESLNSLFKDIHIHLNDVVEIFSVIKLIERKI